jgi:hypothetical protein
LKRAKRCRAESPVTEESSTARIAMPLAMPARSAGEPATTILTRTVSPAALGPTITPIAPGLVELFSRLQIPGAAALSK